MFTEKQNLRNTITIISILTILVGITATGQPLEHLGHCNIPFTGTASGGELILAENLNRNARFANLKTTSGETAESVSERLARLINEEAPFLWGKGRNLVTSSAGTIDGLLGTRHDYIIAGTEVGLGIPEPPTSLSCSLDSGSKTIALRWINPPEDYDLITIVLNWDHYNHRGEPEIPGNSESYVLDLNKRSINLVTGLDAWVFGSINGIPSNAAAVHLDGNSQEELFGIPFTSGVAPNWKAWSLDTAQNIKQFECSIKNNLTAVR